MTAQVATKPSVEKIKQIINSIFGPTEIISRVNDGATTVFIPVRIVEGLKAIHMWQMMDLNYEEKVVSDPTLLAFKL